MTHNDKKIAWVVSLLSISMAIICVITFILWEPAQDNRFGELIINTIPGALVVFLAFPVVFFLFTSRGIALHSEPDFNAKVEAIVRRVNSRTSVVDVDSGIIALPMRRIDSEVVRIEEAPINTNKGIIQSQLAGSKKRDLLLIVDVQKDFFYGGKLPVRDAELLLPPLNEAITAAEMHGAIVVYTQDWHPKEHRSFTENGGIWPQHCLEGSDGAKLHPDLKFPAKYEIIRFGTDVQRDGYSPFENEELVNLVSRDDVGEVFVAGIALEYCILATCLDAKGLGKQVSVIESLVSVAEPKEKDKTFQSYERHRIRKVLNHPWN